MTTVWCDRDDCEHWQKFVCQAKDICFTDGECEAFGDYVDKSPEYQNVFYKHVHNIEDGKFYRMKAKGKKYEFCGHTFYTDWDDREGIDGIRFTEKKTGIAIPGSVFLVTDEEKLAKLKSTLEKHIASAVHVIELIDIPEDQVVEG